MRKSSIPTFRRSSSFSGKSKLSHVYKRSSSEDRIARFSSNAAFLRSSNSRGSSILPEGKHHLKETRPLSDKIYQKRKLQELIEFLESKGFQQAQNLAKIIPPNKKDFEIVFECLVKPWDFQYKIKRIEDEAPKLLKMMGYPFALNKSTFVLITRTNWPVLLGVLLWLMDLNKYIQVIEPELFFLSSDNEKSHQHAEFLKYICESYQNGTNEEENAVIYEKIIMSGWNISIGELENVNVEYKNLVETAERDQEEYLALKEENEQANLDINSLQEFLSKMNAHAQKKEQIYQELLNEFKQRETHLKEIELEIEKKQAICDAQGYDGQKHINYYEAQKKDLISKLEEKSAQFKAKQNEHWDLEIQQAQIVDKVQNKAESFNEMYVNIIKDLNSLLNPENFCYYPQAINFCKTMDFQLPDYKHTAKLQSLKMLQTNIKPALIETRAKVEHLTRYMQSLESTCSYSLQEMELKKNELKGDLKVLTCHKSQKETDLTSKNKQDLEEIATLEVEFDAIKNEANIINETRLNAEEKIKTFERKLQVLKPLIDTKKKEVAEYIRQQRAMFERIKHHLQDMNEKEKMCKAEILAATEKLATM